MKLKNAILQASIAAALVAATAGNAYAVGTWAAANPIALATEVFGTGSNETLITAPTRMYTPVAAGVGDVFGATMATADQCLTGAVAKSYVDVKFTLPFTGAVFGEALNDNSIKQVVNFLRLKSGGAYIVPANMDNGTANTAAAAGHFVAVVTSGGAIGDNTVAVRICNNSGVAASTIDEISFGGYKVKNLQTVLGTDGGVQKLGVNYTTALGVAETADPSAIFVSKNAVDLTLTPAVASTVTATAPTWYINAADDLKKFTTTPYAAGNNDFNAGVAAVGTGTAGTYKKLATVKLTSGTTAKVVPTYYPGGTPILREDQTPFVFMGGDDIKLSLVTSTGKLSAFKAANAIKLVDSTSLDCTAAALKVGTVGNDGTGTDNKVTFDLTGVADATINKNYDICMVADGTNQIEEVNLMASAVINYANVRYVKDEPKDAVNVLAFRNNGATQAIPYALSANNTYRTYLRVANNSDKAGRVTVQCRKNGADSTVNQVKTTGTLDAKLGAHNAKIYDAAALATACGANGATAATDFSYVIVRGEFQYMDAGQYMFNPDGTVTQLLTNPTDGRTAQNGGSLNAN